MQLSKRDMERVFRKLQAKDVVSNHHVSGKVRVESDSSIHIVRLRFSHGRGEIPRPVMHRIRKALALTEREFEVLVSCKMSRETWVNLYSKRSSDAD